MTELKRIGHVYDERWALFEDQTNGSLWHFDPDGCVGVLWPFMGDDEDVYS